MGIRIGGNEARAVGDKESRFMHHFPVKGAGLADDDEIRVNVGDGEAGLVQLVDERAFANDIGFFTFPWRRRKSAVAMAEV